MPQLAATAAAPPPLAAGAASFHARHDSLHASLTAARNAYLGVAHASFGLPAMLGLAPAAQPGGAAPQAPHGQQLPTPLPVAEAAARRNLQQAAATAGLIACDGIDRALALLRSPQAAAAVALPLLQPAPQGPAVAGAAAQAAPPPPAAADVAAQLKHATGLAKALRASAARLQERAAKRFSLAPLPHNRTEFIHLSSSSLKAIQAVLKETARPDPKQKAPNPRGGKRKRAPPGRKGVPSDDDSHAWSSWFGQSLSQFRGRAPVFANSMEINCVSACVHVGCARTTAEHKARRARQKKEAAERQKKEAAAARERTRLSPQQRGRALQEAKAAAREASVQAARAALAAAEAPGAAQQAPTGEQAPTPPAPTSLTFFSPLGRPVWAVGVDPGQRTLVTAVLTSHGERGDTHRPAAKRPLRCPTGAYRNASGFTRRAAALERRKRRPAWQAYVGAEAAAPTAKTASCAGIATHVVHAARAVHAGKTLYGDERSQAAEARVFRAQRRELHRVAQLLSWGLARVRGRWPRQGAWACGWGPYGCPGAPAPPLRPSRPAVSIIGFGDASGGHGSVVSRQGGGAPIKLLRSFITREYCGLHKVHLLLIDEFKTSQVHSRCWKPDSLKHPPPPALGVSAFAFKFCAACARADRRKVPIDRDANAARCIAACLICALRRLERPAALRRS
ncbi:MAG: hypothetical protein J3K34DRAFT_415043 [Monoraphidium minutum]|nr:MAG: hypothetical protein J3K34DRAFT_415043 [Monoraphidium minutum]